MSLIVPTRVERDRGRGGDRPARLGRDRGCDARGRGRRRRRRRPHWVIGRRLLAVDVGDAEPAADRQLGQVELARRTGPRPRPPGGRSRRRTPGCRCAGARRRARRPAMAARPLDGLGRVARRHAEAELRVDLAGPHELVGVGLDARASTRSRTAGTRPSAAWSALEPVELVEAVDHDAARRRPRGRGPARRRSCCCRAAPADRPGRRRRAPRAARRRWRRRGACPPRGRAGPSPGTGTPWSRRLTPSPKAATASRHRARRWSSS